MATREEKITAAGSYIGFAALGSPLIKNLDAKLWTFFFMERLKERAGEIAEKEIRANWSDEFIDAVAAMALSKGSTALRKVSPAAKAAAVDAHAAYAQIQNTDFLPETKGALVGKSTQQAIRDVNTKYHLLLDPDARQEGVGVDSHVAARDEFDRVYKAKLAELSIGDPYTTPPYTFRRKRRTPDEPYPEEVAYEEGKKAYDLKLAEMMGSAESRKSKAIRASDAAFAARDAAAYANNPTARPYIAAAHPSVAKAAQEAYASVMNEGSAAKKPAVPEVNSKGCGPMGCFGRGGRKTRRTRKSRKIAGKRRRKHTRARRG